MEALQLDRRRTGRPLGVFVITALGAFMAALDLSIVNVAFPDLEASYPDASQATLAWVITAYSIVFGALLVTGGRTGDRHRPPADVPRPVSACSCSARSCAAIAPSVPVLIASRVLQGVGRRLPRARLGRPADRRLPARATHPDGRPVGRHRRAGRGHRPVARRGHRLGRRVAVGLLREPAGRRGHPRGSAGACSPSRRSTGRPGRPDYLGVVLVSVAVAAVVFAVSEGTDVGLDRPPHRRRPRHRRARRRGLRARARGTTPSRWSTRRCSATGSFVAANVATFVYAAGFFAMLLGNILFLTGVWDYSIMRAGLAVTPGPLVVAVVAGPAGKLAGRIGFRPVLLAGAACFAAGLLWYVVQVGPEPAYLADWLPGTAGRRARHRPHVPGAQRRRRVLAASAPVRRRQRRQPDRPAGRRCDRRRRAGHDPGRTPERGGADAVTASTTCGPTGPSPRWPRG